jgi:hypothetical protein
LFAGDSFTMAGIDDYCPANRNFVGAGVGFNACLDLVEATRPDLILNNHVDRAFCFSSAALRLMRDNLSAREQMLAELLPWDNPNYGLDEHWIRCHPYEQCVVPGETAALSIVCTNHSTAARQLRGHPVLPTSWAQPLAQQSTYAPPKAESVLAFEISVPLDTRPGRWAIPVTVTYDGRPLGQFREAVLVVTAGDPA